jgi:hypothetical protein
VIEAERTSNGQTSGERRLYIGSIAPDAAALANAVRAHGGFWFPWASWESRSPRCRLGRCTRPMAFPSGAWERAKREHF